MLDQRERRNDQAGSEASEALFQRARSVMPSGYTRDLVAAEPHPHYAVRGEGAWLYDVDGNRRLDWVNNFASMIHGHGRPEIIEALTGQIRALMTAVLPTEAEIRLAELLCERIPSIERVRFTNSGTEANAVAVKAARAYTGRPKVAKMEGGYHGQYDLLEASFLPAAPHWGPADRPAPVAHNVGTPQSLLDELVILPVNDIDNSRAILRERAAELAAVILDPWRVQMGIIEPRPDYLAMLREETERLGIVLIFDEVVSLRASYGGAQGMLGVTPDLTTMGKIIGGGVPIGGVGGKAAFMSVFEFAQGARKVKHSGTFTANPLSMAAGFASMSLLTPEVFDALNGRSERLREGLTRAFADVGVTGRVMGSGSISSVLLVDMPVENYRQAAAARAAGHDATVLKLQEYLRAEGLICLRGCFIGSTAMTDADVDFTLAAVRSALKRLRADA